MSYWYPHYSFKSKDQIQAERKNGRLVQSLDGARETFCGIGTRLTKLMLNRLGKDDIRAAAYRLAVEIEDVNINAKKYFGSYKNTYYNKKEELICQLVDFCESNNIMYGTHHQEEYSTSYIIFFELPDCEQISWHTNASCAKNCPEYDKVWDGISESTLPKLEGAICGNYSEEILKVAKRHNKDVKQQVLDIKRVYEKTYALAKEHEKEAERLLELECKKLESFISEIKENPFFQFLVKWFPDKEFSLVVQVKQGQPVLYIMVDNKKFSVSLQKLMDKNLTTYDIIKSEAYGQFEREFHARPKLKQALAIFKEYDPNGVQVEQIGPKLVIRLDKSLKKEIHADFVSLSDMFCSIEKAYRKLVKTRNNINSRIGREKIN